MKKSIKITISEPCHEDWSKMTPTQKGKHCAVCEKEVIDFTHLTDEQLYKTAISGRDLCGRFIKNQLDRDIQLQRKQGISWASYSASLLIPVAILSTQEITAQSKTAPVEKNHKNYINLNSSSLLRPIPNVISRKRIENDTIKNIKTHKIKGVVSDKYGPIPFCSIYIDGSNKNVTTDLEGNYEIEVTKGAVIVFSTLGYKELKVKVNDQKTINAILKEYELIITGKLRIKNSKNTPH